MIQTDKEEPVRDQRHIQSIEVGFRLISVLETAGAKLPLKVVAERAGMPASKAHLYMVSFIHLGLVVQDAVSMRYGLGPYAVQLGLAGLRQLDVLTLARGPMEQLQQDCGLSVYLSIWGNMGPTIVAKFDGELEVPMTIRVGHVLPLLTSATGRVFLAALPASSRSPVLERTAEPAAKLAPIVEQAKAELAHTGVAVSDSRVFDGFAALSAPVLDNSGVIAAAVTVIGLRSRVEIDPAGGLAAALKSICGDLSRSLGWEPDPRPAQSATAVQARRARTATPRS